DGALEAARREHEGEGLRYIAVVHDGEARASAGAAAVTPPGGDRAGELVLGERRVRVAVTLGPPHPPPFDDHGHDGHGPSTAGERGGHRGGPPDGERGPPPDLGPPEDDGERHPPPWARGGPFHGPGRGPPLLVVEFETPVLDKLRADTLRTVVVAAGAAAALLAFAAAWSRSLRRLAAATEKNERERRLVALGQMSGVMAHELRNPLASLKGHAQLLEESLGDDVADLAHAQKALDRGRLKAARIVGDAERLEKLTSSLLEFAREGAIDVGATSPREIVERAIEHLPKADVRVDTDGAPATVVGDGPRLARALANLVENAAHAGGDAPIDIRARLDGDSVVFEVRDRGPGLPAADRDRLFESFFTTKTRGTGLGLAIARRIAELHGGTIAGTNHPEGGALFTLRVPLA
ncbi:MAG TPA: HAMP domain-containing sensor histidine kinase, partial [Byssovorax sp.]